MDAGNLPDNLAACLKQVVAMLEDFAVLRCKWASPDSNEKYK